MKRIMIAFMITIFVLSGCSNVLDNSGETCNDITCNSVNAIAETKSDSTISEEVEKVEVFHFHGTNQCFSCKTVGAFAEKTVNTYYKDLVDSGKMAFASINAELPENRNLAVKYGVTGSSLWIGTYINGEFHKEENTNVWYKVRDEAGYLSYLKGVLDKRLSGDFS